MMKRNLLFLALLAVSGISLGAPVVAHAAGGITLEPAVMQLTMKPGESWRGLVSVTNGLSEAVVLMPSAANLGPDGGDTLIRAESITERLGTLATWVRPSFEKLLLAPGARETFEVVIAVPLNASPGSHRGLLILTRAQERPGENALSATAGIALGLDLTVVGQPNHRLMMRDVAVAPRVGTKPPILLGATLGNTGNTLPRVSVHASVGRLWGTPQVIELQPENGSDKVAPGSQTLFRGEWSGEGFIPAGVFRARITAQDSSGLYEETRYFTLIPWQVIAGLLAAFVVVFSGRSWAARRLRRRRA